MSERGYNQKSDYAYSFSIKCNAKGQFYIGEIKVKSDTREGLYLMPAKEAKDILKALRTNGFKVVGLNDDKD